MMQVYIRCSFHNELTISGTRYITLYNVNRCTKPSQPATPHPITNPTQPPYRALTINYRKCLNIRMLIYCILASYTCSSVYENIVVVYQPSILVLALLLVLAFMDVLVFVLVLQDVLDYFRGFCQVGVRGWSQYILKPEWWQVASLDLFLWSQLTNIPNLATQINLFPNAPKSQAYPHLFLSFSLSRCFRLAGYFTFILICPNIPSQYTTNVTLTRQAPIYTIQHWLAIMQANVSSMRRVRKYMVTYTYLLPIIYIKICFHFTISQIICCPGDGLLMGYFVSMIGNY